MRLRLLAVLLVAALACVASPVPAAAAPPPTDLPFELESSTQLSPRLWELVFRSPAADGPTAGVRILLPDGYDDEPDTRYPVLYLLHGGGDGEASWTDKGEAEEATAGLPLIVVMPGVTGHGNYVDWYNGGRFGAPMWETFILAQLLPWVDANLRTVSSREGRAVAGLSMGGGGAMGFAARHPDLFVSAAAFSGAVDTNTIPVQLLALTAGLDHGHAIGDVNGDRLTQEVRWRNHNPWDLAENLRPLHLFLTTGNGMPGGPGGDTGDPVELGVWQMMTNLHDRLAGLGIPHHWDDYGAGGHAWWYWQRALRQYLAQLMPVFDDPPAPPSSVTYTTADPAFTVFGWSVVMTRPAMEFAKLVDATPAGFALQGTGTATVTTPAVHAPGASYEVTVDGPDGPRTSRVEADRDGRLTLSISLGPGNPHQQHTLEGRLWALGETGGTWPVRSASVSIAPVAEARPDAPVEPAAPSTPPAPSGGTPSGGQLPATGGTVGPLAGLVALAGWLATRRLRAG